MDVRALRRFAEGVGGVALAAEPMPGGGSARRYFRLRSRSPAPWGLTAVGMLTPSLAEARAFAGFTGHLRRAGIPVPRLYAFDAPSGMAVVEDLGDLTLGDRLRDWRALGTHGAGELALGATLAEAALKSVVQWLARLQVRGGKGLDAALCFDGAQLGGAAFRADLQLFLTHYVPRFVLCPGPGAEAHRELERLVARLDALPRDHLCHRDFQTRNIMWPGDGAEGGPVFIDYQGARFGPLAYDLAALLYSPDTALSDAERAPLLEAYLAALREEGAPQDGARFRKDFYAVVLVRRLQALGAYARIAVEEGKPEYLDKIRPALETLGGLFRSGQLSLGLPHLEAWLRQALAPRGETVH